MRAGEVMHSKQEFTIRDLEKRKVRERSVRATTSMKKVQKILGSCSNDDGKGNENVKKVVGLITNTTTLHVHYTFWYIFLPSLHD